VLSYVPVSDAGNSYRCRCKYWGMIWSSVDEVRMAIAEARSIVINNRIRGERERILWSEGHLCALR